MKFQIVTVGPDIADEPGELRRARGAIEWIEDAPTLSLQLEGRAPQREAASASDYAVAIRHAIEKIRSQGLAIDAVGHRVVHGGNRFTQPAVIDRAVVSAIEALEELAPLHNAPSLAGIRAAQAVLGPDVPMVAVFDTAFHAGLPDHAARYAIPHELSVKYEIRRYGFHGISYRYVLSRYRRLVRTSADRATVIAFHLGNGCSAAAIKDGACVDTSMGFTPLEGLVMGTRSGDLAPALIPYLPGRGGLSVADVERILKERSGLRGLDGWSHDSRLSQGPSLALPEPLLARRHPLVRRGAARGSVGRFAQPRLLLARGLTGRRRPLRDGRRLLGGARLQRARRRPWVVAPGRRYGARESGRHPRAGAGSPADVSALHRGTAVGGGPGAAATAMRLKAEDERIMNVLAINGGSRRSSGESLRSGWTEGGHCCFPARPWPDRKDWRRGDASLRGGRGRAARHGHPRRGELVGRLSGRRSALPTRTSPSTPCSATTSARPAGSRGVDASPDVERDIVPHRVLWSFRAPVARIHADDKLVMRTNCPGEIEWSTDGWRTVARAALVPSGGVMARPSRHAVTLRPACAGTLTFRFRCGHAGCVADTALCRGQEFAVEVGETP